MRKKIAGVFIAVLLAFGVVTTVSEPKASAVEMSGVAPQKPYEDTGCTGSETYNNYNYNSIKKGDLVYEGTGFFGLTGHIGVIDQVTKDANGKITCITEIESNGYVPSDASKANASIAGVAIKWGPMNSVFDDLRMSEREVTIYRPVDATTQSEYSQSVIDGALNYMRAQIGKAYNPVFTNYDGRKADGLYGNNGKGLSSFYCSELAWAGYYSQGVDLRNEYTSPKDVELAAEGYLIVTPYSVSPRDITRYAYHITHKKNFLGINVAYFSGMKTKVVSL
jgi:hypothetical protein